MGHRRGGAREVRLGAAGAPACRRRAACGGRTGFGGGFLSEHTSARERAFFISTAETLWGKDGEPATVDPESFYILLPSFCVSELTKSFQIGFLVYLPFIAIDIIVSNILLAMGMMMVSPVTISLPFKLLLFVMVNGWTLLIQGLVRGYAV